MGNQQTVGWVSTASLDTNDVIDSWISSYNEFYRNHSDSDLHLVAGETRETHFRSEIVKHLRDTVHKRFLQYTYKNVKGYSVVSDKGEFVQVYGVAIKPYSLLNLRAAAMAMFAAVQEAYPEKELRGVIRAISDKGRRLYRMLGAEECDDWHDDEYERTHYTPLRISSKAAIAAANKPELKAGLE